MSRLPEPGLSSIAISPIRLPLVAFPSAIVQAYTLTVYAVEFFLLPNVSVSLPATAGLAKNAYPLEFSLTPLSFMLLLGASLT